jgi:hypothetical protein
MNNEKAQFILSEGCNTVTILEGSPATPLPLKEPKSISFDGNIHAISDYVAIRRKEAQGIQVLNPKTILVEVNKNARTIVMKQDPEAHYSATITAKLEASEELKQFGINTSTRYTRKQLTQLLKFNRLYFSDRSQYDAVVSGLMRIRFKTQAELTQESDNKGTRINNDESRTVAHEGFVDTFTLSVPLFRGFPAVKIEAEICWEVLNSDISFWLESVGLKEATDSAIDGIFEAELDNIRDFVIIHK